MLNKFIHLFHNISVFVIQKDIPFFIPHSLRNRFSPRRRIVPLRTEGRLHIYSDFSHLRYDT